MSTPPRWPRPGHFGASPAAISVTALCWPDPPVVLTAFTGGLTGRFGPRTMLIIGCTCPAASGLGRQGHGKTRHYVIVALIVQPAVNVPEGFLLDGSDPSPVAQAIVRGLAMAD